ncbi:DNA ligase D [soil metagenome]
MSSTNKWHEWCNLRVIMSDLEKYHRRRDFNRTPEPRGHHKRTSPEQLKFVVQKHHAQRLHFDLRLEHSGVLKSWAVPREPSVAPGSRRLAVQTEDHPIAYAEFEGEIPEGEYGAGSMLIWDRGYWTSETDPESGLAEGKLDFLMHGEKLQGRWTLVRTGQKSDRRDQQDNWLLIKRTDRTRRSGSRNDGATTPESDVLELYPGELRGAVRAQLPLRPAPQLATLATEAPSGDGWLNEPKLDGYRLICRIDNQHVTLFTRNGNDWTDRFPGIVDRARRLPCNAAVLDGEAVIYDASGVTNFQRLQSAIRDRDQGIVLVVFDVLHLDGWNLQDVPLSSRKPLLQRLLSTAPDSFRFGDYVVGQGPAFFRQACKMGLEGVIAKRALGAYREGRSQSWLKLKCLQRQEFVIVGFTEPSGSRSGFGALLLGVSERHGEPFRYAGKVGTGFDETTLRSVHDRLIELEQTDSPIEGLTSKDAGGGVHWVRPALVAEVSFTSWTAEGRLRHASFHGLREDKPVDEVIKECPLPAGTSPYRRRPVKLTNPGKVLFPEEGITKQQLANYWKSVAPVALPHIADRPLSLLRCPEGIEAQCFYQKHIGAGVPDVVPRVAVEDDGDPYAMADDEKALIGLTQIGAIELHVWGSRESHLDEPDIIVFDLDPSEELPWTAVVDAAADLRSRLETLGLVAFARLTGGKGLHIVVPVVPGPDWRSVKHFSRTVAREMARDEPNRFTTSMSKSRRTGKIFVDYLRNDRGSTAIASYSPRARTGAPVALPIEWSELRGDQELPPKFGVLQVPEIIQRRKRDPWKDFEAARRSLTE